MFGNFIIQELTIQFLILTGPQKKIIRNKTSQPYSNHLSLHMDTHVCMHAMPVRHEQWTVASDG